MKRGATNVLDQYDFEVLRTWKVRGAILCETTTGIYILKEYNGRSEKLPIQNILLEGRGNIQSPLHLPLYLSKDSKPAVTCQVITFTPNPLVLNLSRTVVPSREGALIHFLSSLHSTFSLLSKG